MRLRLGIAGAVLAAAVIALVAIVAAGGGESGGTGGAGDVLAWEGPPLAITPENLPDDRVAYGTVRNASLGELKASIEDFGVRDASGHELQANVQFLGTYAHGVYGAFERPEPLPESERMRLGYQVDLQSGQTSPLTVSYRLGTDAEMPATLYYRDAPALELPDDDPASAESRG